jgi:hypothetical protein
MTKFSIHNSKFSILNFVNYSTNHIAKYRAYFRKISVRRRSLFVLRTVFRDFRHFFFAYSCILAPPLGVPRTEFLFFLFFLLFFKKSQFCYQHLDCEIRLIIRKSIRNPK